MSSEACSFFIFIILNSETLLILRINAIAVSISFEFSQYFSLHLIVNFLKMTR